jgi:hypothetical protein
MDLNFFENDIFCQIFYINLNKIVWLYFFNFKDFSKTNSRIFQEHSRNISQKAITKAIKKVSNCGL